jgi:hypothetical protein
MVRYKGRCHVSSTNPIRQANDYFLKAPEPEEYGSTLYMPNGTVPKDCWI